MLILIFVCIVACPQNHSQSETAQINPDKNHLDIRLSGTPVVKVLSEANNHWLMTETIVTNREEFERSLRYVRAHEKILVVDHALKIGEYLADIALGPQPEQLWLAIISQSETQNFILRLIDSKEVIWETRITRPINEKDQSNSLNSFFRHLEDVIRIVSEDNAVYIAARNKVGRPFFAAIKDRKIIQDPVIIGPASKGFFVGRISGVYSVMDQLTVPFKMFIASCNTKIVLSWLAYPWEVNDNLSFYSRTEEVVEHQVAVLEIDKVFPINLSSTKAQVYGAKSSLLQSMSCEADHLVISGSARIKEQRASAPFLIQNKKISFFRTEFEKSASAQAIQIVNGTVIMGGSTQWNQNPSGLSIDGGLGFIKIDDKIEIFGEARTELRSISYSAGQLCYAGIIAGPTTHSHDHDPNSITGDGFLKCRLF